MDRVEYVARTLADRIGERPVGTGSNEAAMKFLSGVAGELGYQVEELPLSCKRWEWDASSLRLGEDAVEIFPSPFSNPLEGRFNIKAVKSVDELRAAEVSNDLLVLHGEIAAEPLMPRDFPFYYPDEHREIIDLLTEKEPAGVVALTGRHPLCGLSPFPLFEDGNLGIPNGYTGDERVPIAVEGRVELRSRSVGTSSRQQVFRKTGAGSGTVLVAAHIDTKYGTPGALDNGAGLATMFAVMEALASTDLPFDMEFLPFNGEEYYEVSGQLAYLDSRSASFGDLRLMVNLDGLGHRASKNAFSRYNLSDRDVQLLEVTLRSSRRALPGEEWIAGDHAIFAFQGVPCVAVTSSNLMEELIRVTHTSEDRLELVDLDLLRAAGETVTELLTRLQL